jgi:hypothetical protein
MKDSRIIAAFAAGLLTALGVAVAVGAQSETSQNSFRAGFAALNGNKEIGNDGQTGAGDRNGRGAFNAIIDGDKLCFGLTVANIGKPVAAHIHQARRGKNGDVVLTLKHPRAGDPGASSACTDISSSLARDIRDNPRRFYVNVHNAKFPDGAVRGQLSSGGG